MKKIVLLALVALLVSSCLPQNVRVPQSPLLSTLERKSGLIAYVGIDGNMYVSDQGGGKLQQLTDDALIPQNQGDPFRYYEYPTWAQDGNQVAFVKLAAQDSVTTSTMLVAHVDEKSQKEVYTSSGRAPLLSLLVTRQ